MPTPFENYNEQPIDSNFSDEIREQFRISSRNSALMKILHPQVVPKDSDPLYPVLIGEDVFLPLVSEDIKMIVKEETNI